MLTWLGERKLRVCSAALTGDLLVTALAFWLPDSYSSRATMLPPQQQGGSGGAAAAVAALGALGGLAASLNPGFELAERGEVEAAATAPQA